MKTRNLVAVLLCSAMLTFAGAATALAATNAAEPPGSPFKGINELTGMPQFLPTLGSLYVDPATLPVGPFLAYDRKGTLVGSIYMVPLSELNAHKNFAKLAVGDKRANHVTVLYNAGHPGVSEPHYHFNVWYISPEAVAALE